MTIDRWMKKIEIGKFWNILVEKLKVAVERIEVGGIETKVAAGGWRKISRWVDKSRVNEKKKVGSW